MVMADTLEDLLTHRRAPRGFLEWSLRGLSVPASWVYAGMTHLRNAAYDHALLPVAPAPEGVLIISVGNITLGGAGKTPLVVALAERLISRGHRVGVVLRGYRSPHERHGKGEPLLVRAAGGALTTDPGHAGDEAVMIARMLPGAAVAVTPQRHAAVAMLAAAPHSCEAIVLDDAFQHRRMQRHVDLVLLDLTLRPEARRSFPLGYLREGPEALRRAHAVVVYTEGRSHSDARNGAANWAGRHHPAKVLVAQRRLRGLVPLRPDAPLLPDDGEGCLPTGRWHARWFAGIAHPHRLAASLLSAGASPATITGRAWPDHHDFTPAELADIGTEFRRWQQNLPPGEPAFLVTTAKDAARLTGREHELGNMAYALIMDAELVDEPAWDAALERPSSASETSREVKPRQAT